MVSQDLGIPFLDVSALLDYFLIELLHSGIEEYPHVVEDALRPIFVQTLLQLGEVLLVSLQIMDFRQSRVERLQSVLESLQQQVSSFNLTLVHELRFPPGLLRELAQQVVGLVLPEVSNHVADFQLVSLFVLEIVHEHVPA